VHADAFGQGQEQDQLEQMFEGVRENFQAIGKEEDIFSNTKLSADRGFHSAKNMKTIYDQQIDAYVADTLFRKRDPRFADTDRYKERSRRERRKRFGQNRLFSTEDFTFAPDLSYWICPAGKRLYQSGAMWLLKDYARLGLRGRNRPVCRAN